MELVRIHDCSTPKAARMTVTFKHSGVEQSVQQGMDSKTARLLAGKKLGYFKASYVNNRWHVHREVNGVTAL